MNHLLPATGSPVLIFLGKWTVLLALGWAAHGGLLRQHARWRRLLWRSLLGFSLLLPLAAFLPLPVFTIPVYAPAVPARVEVALASAPENEPPAASLTAMPANGSPPQMTVPVGSQAAFAAPALAVPQPFSWAQLGLLIWVFGGVMGAARLGWLQIRLRRLRRQSRPADATWHQLTQTIQRELNVRQPVAIRLSSVIQSPFVCGLWQPVILLPQSLAITLSPAETMALLRHEIAHLRGHDLIWCNAWRWLQVIAWFHPLVWAIPAAHNLACEQEADRLASGPAEDRATYAQLLAQVALRVLTPPAVETHLTLNGSAQIVRRLQHLQRPRRGWKTGYSGLGFSLATLLFILSAGCEFSRTSPPASSPPPATEFKRVQIVVLDDAGRPVAGASVQPFGFRVKGPRNVDAYGWITNRFGPRETAVTDADGKAWLKYPVTAFPSEKLLTADLTLTVHHPKYTPAVSQSFHVDGGNDPIRLTPGIELEVSGYYGPDHQNVTNLVANLSQESVSFDRWIKSQTSLFFHQLAPGGHMIQLMGQLPSGELVYSDSLPFTAVPGQPCHFNLKMKPGVRLEGRLDASVPRPVINGRVLINVRPPQIPAFLDPNDVTGLWEKYGRFHLWHSYRPIAADGTFVFESIPPGEVDVAVLGDGFASKSTGWPETYVRNGKTFHRASFGVPQPFPLTTPVTRIEIVTEPTATLEVNVKTRQGTPIKGADACVNPNIFRMGGIFGSMSDSSEDPFRKLSPLPPPPYHVLTDQNGLAVLRNIPALGHTLAINHPQFVVPIGKPVGLPDRHVLIHLTPGQTTNVNVTMEPAGKDYIGTAK